MFELPSVWLALPILNPGTKNKGLWKGQQTRPCICLNLMIEDQIEDSGYDYCPPEARAGARPPPPLSRGTAGRLGLN